MNCPSCSTPLPTDALFCGECGRSVTVVNQERVLSPSFIEPPPAVSSEPLPDASGEGHGATTDHAPISSASSTEQKGVLCQQCGSSMTVDDIFCGVCGQVSPSFGGGKVRDTVALDRKMLSAVGAPPPTPDTVDDVEVTRITDARGLGDRFVLQFSTGESVTVSGSGLIGRNPLPEPGERFDVLVRVVDATRSVSKTHLEFGQEAGAFWLRDRFSGNGSVLRAPESPPFRCEAGKRYRVSRGSRIDIGEQFFVVS